VHFTRSDGQIDPPENFILTGAGAESFDFEQWLLH
jgi:hypothetical protein